MRQKESKEIQNIEKEIRNTLGEQYSKESIK